MAYICLAFTPQSCSHELRENLNFDRTLLNTKFADFVVLSLRHRIEFYTTTHSVSVHHQNGDTAFELLRFLSRQSGIEINQLNQNALLYFDLDAVRHLFQITSGRDSSDSDTLGLVGKALQDSERDGKLSSCLGRIFKHAIRVGQRAATASDERRNEGSRIDQIDQIVTDELTRYRSQTQSKTPRDRWKSKLDTIRTEELIRLQCNDTLDSRVCELLDRYSQAVTKRIAEEIANSFYSPHGNFNTVFFAPLDTTRHSLNSDSDHQ